MNLILLSGGSGKRLWPLSNDIRSKQFIKFFKNGAQYESMVQRIFRQIRQVDANANVTIATNLSQVSTIRNQLGGRINVCIEPCRRDTFPAIALASAYLHDILKLDDDEAVVICPVDPFVGDEYFQMIQELGDHALKSDANLVLMGIKPLHPCEKYGYIIPETCDRISKIKMFKEKPATAEAEKYIASGALWNGGVFAFRLGYMLKKAQELIGFSDYGKLYENYDGLEKISFDYAVVEKECAVEVMRYNGQWRDLGTWNTLTEAIDDQTVGNATLDEKCRNVHVINELELPVLCMGMKDCVVAASPEGILVADKERSSCLKPYADKIAREIMFADKSWGSYRIIDVQRETLTILVSLLPDKSMSYHSHASRDEVWNVIAGQGIAVIDGVERSIRSGDVVNMPAGCRHTVTASADGLRLIEIQFGKDISKRDKQKFER